MPRYVPDPFNMPPIGSRAVVGERLRGALAQPRKRVVIAR
jgi:hypothetical protein